jgi:hypothetical protein
MKNAMMPENSQNQALTELNSVRFLVLQSIRMLSEHIPRQHVPQKVATHSAILR